MNTGPASAQRLVVLLDDAASGPRLLELSCALAQALRRELALVFVEDRRSLSAAALPLARVLPGAATGWMPLSPDTVERGFRAHAERLRAAALRIAQQHRVPWSLRVMRGDLAGAAADLQGESDLLLLCANRPVSEPRPAGARRTRIAVTRGSSEADTHAMEVARQWAQALTAMLETLQEDAPDMPPGSRPMPANRSRPDVLVMRRPVLSIELLQSWFCPVLLVD